MAIRLKVHEETGKLMVDFDDQQASLRMGIATLSSSIEHLKADQFTRGHVLTAEVPARAHPPIVSSGIAVSAGMMNVQS